MTGARHELGTFINNEEAKKDWKSKSHVLGRTLTQTLESPNLGRQGLERKTELLAKNKQMRRNS